MRFLFVFCALVFSLQSSFAALRHRASLGIAVEKERVGVRVTAVVPQGTAEAVGLEKGDIVLEVNGHAIVDLTSLQGIVRSYYEDDPIEISTVRAGKNIRINGRFSPFPEERPRDLLTEYTSFKSRSNELSALIVSPAGSEKSRLPAVLIVAALSSSRLANAGSLYSMSADLAYGLARAGFRVLRFELSGSGDSEGVDFRKQDFESMLKDNLAAIDFLKSRKDVDPKSVYLFGHSTDGIAAGILGSMRDNGGVVLSSTIGRTFYERMSDTLRFQLRMDGKAAEEIHSRIEHHFQFLQRIVMGESIDGILKKDRHFGDLVNANGRIHDDRTIEFWRQLLSYNFPKEYMKIKSPVLIVWGTSDFLTQRTCHEVIAGAVKAGGNNDVSLEIVDNLSHRYTFAKSPEESWTEMRQSRGKMHPEIIQLISGWLKKRQ
ncbi:MAG: hypothetical protein A2X94_09030 [Bdellovibrionales bacterium GWB1_55_8]|nr:MAG: hypothetical protein A2X94_09030 [Bdellovibrionales bacterium GWB1_55_8]